MGKSGLVKPSPTGSGQVTAEGRGRFGRPFGTYYVARGSQR